MSTKPSSTPSPTSSSTSPSFSRSNTKISATVTQGVQTSSSPWTHTSHTPLYTPTNPRTVTYKDELLKQVIQGSASLLFDGAMGTQLQAQGLEAGALPELLCLTNPQKVSAIHASYVAAGAQVITTNTFGANRLKLAGHAEVQEIFAAAVACAKEAHPRYVAADIGPLGALLQPLGTLPFDEAYDLFAEQAVAATKAGADLFIIETMTDLTEAKAAILACKEYTTLPIFCTITFGEDGRTFLGTTPEIAALTLSTLGAEVVGINCSLGPAEIVPLIKNMRRWSRVPLIMQANAGLPQVVDGKTIYSIDEESYAAAVSEAVRAGVKILGGCCGTTPRYIERLQELLQQELLQHTNPTAQKDTTPLTPFALCSSQELCELPLGHVAVIGERINPTGKPKMKQALVTHNYDYILQLAQEQANAGAQILDVNAGLPELDEAKVLTQLISDIQGVVPLPLQIDSADPIVIQTAVRSYGGRPIINSCNGKKESLDQILPLAAHYGACIVGLTLDEGGIPQTAQGRLEVARKIVHEAKRWGLAEQDIILDCLALALSTERGAGATILEAIRLVKQEFPLVKTVLGVSNVSFGLPYRSLINATFLAAAFGAGLDFAIINPSSEPMMQAVRAWRVISGEDEGAANYVDTYGVYGAKGPTAAPVSASGTLTSTSITQEMLSSSADGNAHLPAGSVSQADAAPQNLTACAQDMIINGRKAQVKDLISQIIAQKDALYAINDVLIPALDVVGERFERGTFFLPQLMSSAEAAKAGFEVIKEAAGEADTLPTKGAVCLCTVKGDIHDIGKNIVKMLLDNYGYEVYDLGRDVDPQLVVDTVVEHHIKLAGLSALMTATVPAMEETIKLLHAQAPWCKVVVGGAVLNAQYASMVGADFYAKDANETARIASEVLGS